MPHPPTRGADRPVSASLAYDPDLDAVPRRFILVRRTDVSGLSGTGIVAHGFTWPDDGRTVMRWTGSPIGVRQFSHFDHPRDVVAVHGHNGATLLRWLDPAPRGWLADAPTT